MERRALLTRTGRDAGQPALSALPLAHVPGFVGAVAAQAGNAFRSRTSASASRCAERSAPEVPGCNRGLSAEPADLVGRALAILTEETQGLQARQDAKLAPRSIR
jgi:hypothetical protein